MAVFNDFELTNAGINLLGQVSTGQPLIFTKIKLGGGNFIGNVKYLTDLFSAFKEVGVSDIVIQEDDSINIKSEFSNDGFSTSKEWKEIGVFAKAGETGTEVLYSYSYSLLTVETIPDETIPYRRDLNFRNYISDITNVTYDITIQKDKYDFDSDVAMQSASYLAEGDRVNVWKNDSCQKRRVAVVNDNGILLNNGLYANLILDIQGKALAYQKPLDSIYGSITAENGRLYTSGTFNNITGLDKASVLEYGDSKIITTPDNSFNAIVEEDKLYVGPSYKNIVQNPIDYPLRGSVVQNLTRESFDVVITSEQADGGRIVFPKTITENMVVSFTVNDYNKDYIVSPVSFSGVYSYDENKFAMNGTSGSTQYIYIGFYNKDGSNLNVGDRITISYYQIVEGTEEKPFIPPQYTFPSGALSFDGTENIDGSCSYIMSGLEYGKGNIMISHHNSEGGFSLSRQSKNLDYLAYSSLSQINSNSTTSIPTKYQRLQLNYWSFDYAGTNLFNKIVIYNNSLTQAELESELSKNLYIEGKVDVIDKIENSMRIGVILGKRPQGNIQDNVSNTTVGDIWYDEANEKYYECEIATDENFIDLNKWEERSVNSAYDRGSLGIANASTAQAKANSAYTLASGKEPSFTKNSGFNKVMVDVPENSSTKLLSAKGLYDTTRIVESGNNANGYYRKYSDGIIEQWGKTGAVNYQTNITITYPIEFPNEVLSGSATPNSNDASANNSAANFINFGSTTQAILRNSDPDTSYLNILWHVIGY